MSSNHKKYHFSATCKTDDEAVLNCLRALCQYSDHGGYPNIGWGGTSKTSWKAKNGEITLRFASATYRDQFIKEANRLLRGRWDLVGTDDHDPAKPQR